jgi:hypothetical protein
LSWPERGKAWSLLPGVCGPPVVSLGLSPTPGLCALEDSALCRRAAVVDRLRISPFIFCKHSGDCGVNTDTHTRDDQAARYWLQYTSVVVPRDGLRATRPAMRPTGSRDLSVTHRVQTGSGVHQRTNGQKQFLTPATKSEAGHSSPPSAEVKNGGAIPPLLHTSS